MVKRSKKNLSKKIDLGKPSLSCVLRVVKLKRNKRSGKKKNSKKVSWVFKKK